MTERLKQAAQQATRHTPVLSDDEVRHYATCCVTTEDAIRAAEQKVLERALTTSQPAQAGEVDAALTELFRAAVDWGRTYGRTYSLDHMAVDDACEHWASQARASLPTQPAAQTTPERHLTVTTIQHGDAVMVSWQDDEHRILEVVWERKQATPEPSRGMIGMGAHALANELAQAVAQDDADPEGHDMSAGLFGPNVSAWLRKVAAEYLSRPATTELVGEPAAWRWFNSNGDQVTNWLDFKPSQKASVEAQVAEVGGRIEYAYTRPAPGVPEGFALVPMTEREAVACLIKAGCDGIVKMSYGSGPYEITRTSVKANNLIRAVEAHHAARLAAAQAKKETKNV